MHHRRLSPAPAPLPWPPSPSPHPAAALSDPPPSYTSDLSSPPPSKLPVDFSPPLIAMVVIIATAFVIITYSRLLSRHFIHIYRSYRRWRRRRRRYVPSSSAGDMESPPYAFDPTDAFHVLSPYGLDESIIKTIPLSVYTRKSGLYDCAVCLLEFEENDYVRTLPVCTHAFHVDCIDIWLRSHANCPLCRAGIFRQDSPFTPLMAARIRPSLDDMIIESTILEPLTEIPTESEAISDGEITPEPSPQRHNQSEDRLGETSSRAGNILSVAVPARRRKLVEQTTFPVQLTIKTQSILLPLLQRNEIPILPAAEHRRILTVIRVELTAQRRQFVEEDKVVRQPIVHAVIGCSGWRAVFVEPAEERRSRGAIVTGEIQQTVRMGDTWMAENRHMKNGGKESLMGELIACLGILMKALNGGK
ncbi:hypothetical protein ACS0TY_003641 [Phlomoides rotata]